MNNPLSRATLVAALLSIVLAPALRAQVEDEPIGVIEDGTQVEWAGTIDSVETQSKTFLLRTDDGIRKLLYEKSTEIFDENGQPIEAGQLEKGRAVHVQAVKRSLDFLAKRITLDPSETRTEHRSEDRETKTSIEGKTRPDQMPGESLD